ncbi:MAG: sulfotransferase [Pirellulales bacterium]|nr:sulfotransferase [Pirellulales bacterium]
MIIFTGSGRSGTKLYAMLFDAHHEYAVDRLKTILEREVPKQDAPLTNPLTDPTQRRRIMEEHLAGIDLATFRDSSNPYIHFIDALVAMDPEVKIVLGVRDGRDFVRSGVSRGYHTSAVNASFGMRPGVDDPYYDNWSQLSPIQKCAWQWTHRNHKALTGLKDAPQDQWTLVRLEDLTANPRRELHLTRLEEFVGRRAERLWLDVKVNKNASFQLPPKEEWSDTWNQEFYEIAGPLMHWLGYPTPERYAAGSSSQPSPAMIRRNSPAARAT